MAGGKTAPFLLEGVGDGEEAAALVRHRESQRDFHAAVRRDGREGVCCPFLFRCSCRYRSCRFRACAACESPAVDRCPIEGEAPRGADDAGGVCKVHMVFHSEDLPVGIIAGTQGAVDVFVFQKSCVRCPVGIDQTVQAEIAVML